MPTEAGLRLLSRLEPAIQQIGDAVADIQELQDVPVGTIRLNVPRPAARLIFAPRLAAFAALYPRVQIEVLSDDRLIDIVREGFDAGVRFGETLASDMIAVAIGAAQRFVVVGSPGYLAAFGLPGDPQDLVQHRCIGRRFQSGSLYHWEFERAGRSLAIAVRGSLIADDDDVMIRAAIDGAGLAYVYEADVKGAISADTLRPVLDDWCHVPARFFLYYPSRKQVPPALRAVIDFFKSDVAS